MPAAAVIPAPIAYIKVVAVKKLVVGFRVVRAGLPLGMHWSWTAFLHGPPRVVCSSRGVPCTFTLRKSECSKQAFAIVCVSMG